MVAANTVYMCTITRMIVLTLRETLTSERVPQWYVAVLAPPVYHNLHTDEPFDVDCPPYMNLQSRWLSDNFERL